MTRLIWVSVGVVRATMGSMAKPHFDPVIPREPAWDITFTRLVHAVSPWVADCALGLARRFRAIGLGIDTQIRQTPRGFSTFLALVGERGLICIVDLTLVDGMAIGQGPGAVLDIRLLDSCGEVVAEGMTCLSLELGAAHGLRPDHLERAGTAVYVAALAHFELLRHAPRHA